MASDTRGLSTLRPWLVQPWLVAGASAVILQQEWMHSTRAASVWQARPPGQSATRTSLFSLGKGL